MVLTLLRHAPPPLAFHGRYIGHSDIPIDSELFHPLTLPSAYDVIYSSDLIRCTQTLEQLGYRDYQTDERLREVRFKEAYEGKSFDEIERMDVYNPRFLESEELWHSFICDEKAENFRSRIASFLEELPREQNILICTHAGTIREILFLLENRPKRLNYLEYTIVTVK
ncbi:histidine phosphatase family protein [Sulfuricurvum sp.]|uniref:histidine phosphatase family protein n=1 Tax=Sulfuricurvum sp. TaxID=2025608 RepID=UPI003BAFEF55